MAFLKNGLIFCALFFLSACSSITNYSPSNHIPKDGMITVLPFKNNTDTLFAGLKAKNIMEAILVSKNCSVKISSFDKDRQSDKHGDLYNITTRYYLLGNINEWRYKTGLDAEPAVALNFNIVDRANGKVVYSAVGAKSGWGRESLGSIAQKLMLELVDR